MKFIVSFLLVILIYGCSATSTLVSPESFNKITPELNANQETEIGVSLVSKEVGSKYKVLRLLRDTKIKTGYIMMDVKQGESFIHNKSNSKYDLYTNIDNPTYGIGISKSGGKPITFYNSTFDNNSSHPIEYKITLTPLPKKEYLKQDFIYNGKVGNAIKFTYREFIDDIARPAFTQDLQYDLTESKTVGFRGLRVEIISATNTKIQYKVLSYYDEKG